MQEYRFPYHGLDRSFRAVLLAPDGLFQGPEAPFCVLNLIGQFLERLDDAFAMPRAMSSFHVPVMASGNWHTVHVELESQVAFREKHVYDDADDASIPITGYTDGVAKITKYAGPIRWRREDWGKATIAVSGLDPKS